MRRNKRNESGIALVVCILSLLLLTGIALGLMYMTDSETMINSNYRASQQAYFASLAGLQSVRERMTPANVAPHLVTGPATMPGGAASVMYVVNPNATDTINLASITSPGNSFYDNELCKEQDCTTIGAGWYAPLIAEDPATLNTLNYKWVRIILKSNGASAPYYNTGSSSSPLTQICWDGNQETTVTSLGVPTCSTAIGSNPPGWNPVYQLTSLAVTPSGASRMLQMEVSPDPPLVTHGAVDSQDHVDLNGQLDINAYDFCSCSCTTTKVSGQDVTTCTNRAGKSCDGSKYAIYASGTVDPPGPSQTFTSGQTPAIAQNQPWAWDLDGLVNQFRNDPGTVNTTQSPYNYSCSGGTCGTHSGQAYGVPPNFPPSPPDNPTGPIDMSSQVTYVPGDVQLSGNSQGYGVLVVDGNLDIHGGFSFYGLIIVKGVISFTGGGSQGVNIYGGVIAGQQSLVDNVLGGSVNINYDYCALPQPNKNKPPRVLSMRELNF
jgi:hypothetical protein